MLYIRKKSKTDDSVVLASVTNNSQSQHRAYMFQRMEKPKQLKDKKKKKQLLQCLETAVELTPGVFPLFLAIRSQLASVPSSNESRSAGRDVKFQTYNSVLRLCRSWSFPEVDVYGGNIFRNEWEGSNCTPLLSQGMREGRLNIRILYTFFSSLSAHKQKTRVIGKAFSTWGCHGNKAE